MRGFLLFAALLSVQVSAADQPNVVLFLADDLGWGDVGSYGQTKIRTPNIPTAVRRPAAE